MSERVFEHSLSVTILVVLCRMNFNCSRLDCLMHYFVHIRNKQTDNCSYPFCAYWFKSIKMTHYFVQMKNCTINFQFCHMNASVIIPKTKMFRCAELRVKFNIECLVLHV